MEKVVRKFRRFTNCPPSLPRPESMSSDDLNTNEDIAASEVRFNLSMYTSSKFVGHLLL